MIYQQCIFYLRAQEVKYIITVILILKRTLADNIEVALTFTTQFSIL